MAEEEGQVQSNEEEVKQEEDIDDVPPHITDDPEPPESDASQEEWQQYRDKLASYAREWCHARDSLAIARPRAIWADFVNEFSKTGVENLGNDEQIMVREILLRNGIYIKSARGYPRVKALVECWESNDAPLADSRPITAAVQDVARAEREASVAVEAAEVAVGAAEAAKSVQQRQSRQVEDTIQRTNGERTGFAPGLSGLMRAYTGRQKYSGGWDEDLLGCIEVYEMVCRMCELDIEQMRKGVVVMLDGPALAYYASNLKDNPTYEGVIDGLKLWYTSEEQRSRLLREWQGTSLTAWMRKSPEKSEVGVFRDLSAYLSKVQRQLHPDYRKDRFLKDQLVACADIPHVARALREKVPTSVHEAEQRIASLLSSEPHSAGAYTVDDNDSDEPPDAYYGLGQRYRGKAQRRVQTFKGKGQSRSRDGRFIKSKKLAMIKGCWVCGENHIARRFHSESAIVKALEKHKSEGAFVSVEGILEGFFAESDDDASVDSNVESDDQAMMAEGIADINADLEFYLANYAFAHGYGFINERKRRMQDMERTLREEDQNQFNGVMIDTGANRSSIISLKQYRAYCREYGIPGSILKSPGRSIGGIGGRCKVLGVANIAVPFDELGIVADVLFKVVDDDSVPTLLCLGDMKRIGLDLSIQEDKLYFMGKEQNLSPENDLLYHRWAPDVALYTTSELLKLHRSFGHPTVSGLTHLLRKPVQMKWMLRFVVN